jgi:membrane protease YdiL (CAAX protease family)
MRFNWFENSSEGTKFIVSIAAMVGFMAIGTIISVIFAMPFYGMDVIKSFGGNGNLNISLLKFFQAFQSIFMFIIPPLVLAVLFGYKPANYLSYKSAPRATGIIAGILLILSIIPVINFTQLLNSQMKLPEFMSGIERWMKSAEDNANFLTQQFVSTTTIGGFLVNVLVMAIIPAIGEELTFRGLFQQIFTRWTKNYHVGILLAGAFFSAFHLQFYGFIPRFILGITFGYILAWTGCIWIPIVMHFMNNFLSILSFYLYNKGIIGNDLDTLGIKNGYQWGTIIISIIISGFILYLFYKFYNNKEKGNYLNTSTYEN